VLRPFEFFENVVQARVRSVEIGGRALPRSASQWISQRVDRIRDVA
jgi:hypothetical protein